jgi:glutathione synthase/RimK-type ligase-like ATP-grasp enzyme
VSLVAIATTSAVVDPDLDVLVAALDAQGCEGVPVAWDAAFDWSGADLVVLRSTWDYAPRVEAFLEWTTTVPRLCNPADVVAWNADKRYLGELAARGVPVVETTYATHGADAVFPEGRVVVKPSVGAGSRGAHRFEPDERDAAIAHVDALGALGLVAMVQPYLEGIELGETAVVLVDGAVSHAVRKFAPMGLDPTALPAGPLAVEPVEPSPAELAVVDAVLDALPWRETLCYARVDLVATGDGPVVLEAELIEPYLFLTTDHDAARTLARAIVRRVDGPS